MSTEVIPTVAIHEIYSGSKFTGVPSDGVGSEEEIERGRIQKWLAGSVGGEFDAPALVGMRVEQVWWSLDCAAAPQVDIYIVDDDGIEYLIHSAAASLSGEYNQTNGGFLVPPGFKVRVKTDQNINAVVAVAGEVGPAAAGVTDYEFTLVNGRVDPTTVSIVAGAVTFTDPAGDGILVGAGGSGGSGTIDYLTGEVSITLSAAGDFAAGNVASAYSYNRVGRVGIVKAGGWEPSTFVQAPELGKEARVPGPPVP